MIATPILDRRVPLPSTVPPRSEMQVVYVVWGSILAALAIGLLIGRPAVLRRWLVEDVPRLIGGHGDLRSILFAAASVLVVSFVMVTVHELGHVLGGAAAGFRFRSIRIGPLQLESSPFKLSVGRFPGNPFAGVAVTVPVVTDRLVSRGKMMLAGGPAANILTGCLGLLLPTSFPALLFVVQSIGNGLSDLLPYRSILGVSDGAFLWALYRHPARAERWLASMRLGMDIRDGILPEALPADFIEKAVAIRDDSVDTVAGHALAFLAAYHQHRNDDAARMLETCLTFSHRAPAPLRQALISEAVVFEATRCGRVDLAEQWFADLPSATRLWLRSRAEAAILQAKGDVRGAAEKLDASERQLSVEPATPQRAYSLRLLQRWKSELTRSPVV
jgi:hypothetical protein